MKIGVFINTPADFYFYINIIKLLEKKGIQIYKLFRTYGGLLQLMKEERVSGFIFSNTPNSQTKKILSLPKDVLRAYRYLKQHNVDLITGFGVYDAYTSKLLKKPSILFTDTEPSINVTQYIQFKLYVPFADVIISPEAFRDNLGKKHLKVASYKELAYLHPNYYKPSKKVFEILGLSKGEDYVLIRFNSFDALHDAGINGFTNREKATLVKELKKFTHVFISTEGTLPKDIRDKAIWIPGHTIHDAIYYAKLVITETQTIATESAILGTPVVRYNKFVGPKDMSNLIELEQRYGLVYNIDNPKEAMQKAIELVQNNNLKKEWRIKREKLLKEKIDMARFMAWFLENYPDSLIRFKEDPSVQYRFK